MGQALQSLAGECGAEVAAVIDQGDQIGEQLSACDAAIDFSFHAATVPLCELAAAQGKPVVIGTTGHTPQERRMIEDYARCIPISLAGNYSIGVNLLLYLTEKAAGILDQSYQPEVQEIHHRHKKDAPSGTAQNLVEAILAGRQWGEETVRHGRAGLVGERPIEEVATHALRGGEVIGEHTVYFLGDLDRLELTHRASDRRIFASGAYRAAHWLTTQPPGLYSMRDILGLK